MSITASNINRPVNQAAAERARVERLLWAINSSRASARGAVVMRIPEYSRPGDADFDCRVTFGIADAGVENSGLAECSVNVRVNMLRNGGAFGFSKSNNRRHNGSVSR